MKFKSHYSSSKANLYCVTAANGKRLLIECGCTWKQLQKALKYDLSDIVGALCTHEHRDHSRAVEDVMQAGIDVYSSQETFDALGVVHRRAIAIEARRTYSMDGFEIFPFELNHDVPVLGFVIEETGSGESLLFITDTSHIKQRFALEFSIIAICCGYDGAVLHDRVDRGDINEELAKRLLTSHMEQEVTKSYLRDCCNLGKCTEIWLLHMSESNIDKERVRGEIEKEFFISTLIAGRQRSSSLGKAVRCKTAPRSLNAEAEAVNSATRLA